MTTRAARWNLFFMIHESIRILINDAKKKKKSSIFKSNLSIYCSSSTNFILACLTWLIMTYHYSTRRELPHSRCTWLAPHILQGLCCVIQKLHRVNVSLSLSLRMTIVFISLPTSLLFKYKENNISIRKFWVTRIVVTVDSSSFLLIMLSFTLNGKFALLLLFFQNKKLEYQKRMSLWTFCGKE